MIKQIFVTTMELNVLDKFWRGEERWNEKKFKSVSILAQVVFGWMVNRPGSWWEEKRQRTNDLKSLARTCKMNAHIVKKFRWQFDRWNVEPEKDGMRCARKKKNWRRSKKLRFKRYKAYDELIKLIEDPEHYKYNSKWTHYVKREAMVGPWTVEQALWTFNGGEGHRGHGRIRQKWKDQGRAIEHLHFYQYYRDKRGRDIHYHRSYDGKVEFTIHELSDDKTERLHMDWSGHS